MPFQCQCFETCLLHLAFPYVINFEEVVCVHWSVGPQFRVRVWYWVKVANCSVYRVAFIICLMCKLHIIAVKAHLTSFGFDSVALPVLPL